MLRLAGLFLAAVVFAAPAQAVCRQALAIGLDISGSVDAAEYRLQLDGLASALVDAEVQQSFMAMPGADVWLYIYEWGGYGTQRPLYPWTAITSGAELDKIAARLLATVRAPHDPATAIGKAMLYGAQQLGSQVNCWRYTLDLSGDGKSNIGPLPTEIRDSLLLVDVTVNALVIGADAPPFTDKRSSEISELSAYFRTEVIRGPEAFVETAIEFEEFRTAMARKLIKELQTRAVGASGQ
ncbi:MAG: DUF1194 domain-containing protein [Paracoccaceae bacterium]